MRSQGKILQTGEIEFSTGVEDDDIGTQEYEVYVIAETGMVRTVIEAEYGGTIERYHELWVKQDGEPNRADKRDLEKLLSDKNTSDFIVRVSNEESTPSKVLRDVNFSVRRGATSSTQSY